jgi:hypothetical protein
MSEKIYACLLRLYPAGFRRRFETEVLQLLRDRLRQERGLVPKLRLCMDLLVDFVAGLPQAYRNTYATPAPAACVPPGSGLPAFRSLEEEPLRPGSIMMGSILALGALALFIFVMSHVSAYHPLWSNGRLRAAANGTESNPDVQAVAENVQRQMQRASRQQECSFEQLELHPGNVGYVKLNAFPDPTTCGEIAEAVMSRLGETDAIIFDLRDNRGGYPEMVRRLAGWLFDHPVAWYNPRATSAAQRTTAPAPQSRLDHKPVFVLTSRRTFSAAEHFTYNLKSLKRATIVGERTSGASHADAGTAPSPIALSEPKPVWEGVGVEPDVKVDAARALATAEKLALAALHRK